MRADERKQAGGGIGFFGVVFIVLLVLKLTEQIDWSWWLVTAPLWAPAALGLVLAGLYYSFRKMFWRKRQ